MRTDVEIPSKGVELAGWLYTPAKLKKGERRPAIVMAHGLTAVKEMYLDAFAERFCAAGFVVTVFDYRFQGASPGEPRGQVFPDEQHDDYRNAITWTQALPIVDPERIGIWGSSYSGAHVMQLTAFDRRVKCAACQVPLVDGYANARRLIRADHFPGFLKMLSDERAARMDDPGKVSYLPVVAEDGNAVLPTPDSFEWFTSTGKSRAPNWENQITFESVEKFLEYRPVAFAHLIAPTPFLMVVASNDVLTPTDLAISAFEEITGVKKLVVMPGGHFDAYVEPHIAGSAGPATEWFTEHLM